MVLSSARSQAIDGSGRQVATEGQGTSQDLGDGLAGSRVHAQQSRWRLPREARGRRDGRAMALLSWWQPQIEAEAEGWREDS